MTTPPGPAAGRQSGIGASEIGAIVGADPYRSEWDLLLEKRGQSQRRNGSWAMTMGHLIQRLAPDVYRDLTGRKTRQVHQSSQDPRWPHVWVTPDLRVIGERRLVEVKFTSRVYPEPPRHWEMQVQAQMAVTGIDACDILMIHPYREPVIFEQTPEPWGIEMLDMAEAWYVRHVIEGIDPPIDGSQAASRHLDSLRGTEEREATPEQLRLLQTLRAVRSGREKAEEDERRVINQLKASMAATGVLRAPGARVTWSETRGRSSTDWQAVARVAWSLTGLGAEKLDEEVERHTSVGEPSTRFAVRFEEEEQS